METGSVSPVNGGFLRLIGIVYNTELAVFYICMNFYIVVGAEPFVQVVLIMGTPQNRTVQQTAVFKAVWKSAHVYGAALSKLIYCQVDTFACFNQHFCAFQSVHILLVFAKINGSLAVFGNKVAVGIPVVLVVSKSKASLFFNTKYVG